MTNYEYDENAKQYRIVVIDPETEEEIGETAFGLSDPRDLLAIQVEGIIEEGESKIRKGRKSK